MVLINSKPLVRGERKGANAPLAWKHPLRLASQNPHFLTALQVLKPAALVIQRLLRQAQGFAHHRRIAMLLAGFHLV